MIIQQVLTPYKSTEIINKLYFNPLSGNVRHNDGAYTVSAGGKISFNTYINSFYESYWFDKTEIDSVNFEFTVKGVGEIELYRDTTNNGCNLIHLEKFDTNLEKQQSKILIKVDLNRDNLLVSSGRIFFDVNAISDINIESIYISTDAPVKREVDLSIGICTFNRESYLSKNIEGLLALANQSDFLKKIIIVNQGNSFSDENLISYVDDPRVCYVEQSNLGGTGGFTRSMVEALKFDAAYHLLMDDDIVLDSRLLERVVAFASYAKQEVAIGGQMLDALKPNIMHEYGALIKDDGYIKPLLSNLDFNDIGSLFNFNKVVNIDYNAWWFCAIPLNVIKEIDLPAPIFIRGDDEEFGLRIKRSGRETVGLPSIGVWHEPFYMKAGGWQTYYDFRNRFILSSVYSGMKPQSARSLSWSIYSALLNHDYQFAALVIEAVKDFSKGDKLFEERSDIVHDKVMKIAKKYAPKDVIDIDFKPPKEETIKKPWESLTLRGMNVAKQSVKNALPVTKKAKKYLYDRHIHPVNIDGQSYVKTNGIQSYKFLYENKPEVFRELLVEYIKAMKLYNRAIQNKKSWSNITNYREIDSWYLIFNK